MCPLENNYFIILMGSFGLEITGTMGMSYVCSPMSEASARKTQRSHLKAHLLICLVLGMEDSRTRTASCSKYMWHPHVP